ncbi:hypothetical protein KEC56_00310 [Microbacterium sp. YMB-B2]|uniref:SipW-cognate class signal peptide n=1 Tax=Microbacterium tenebrionis TaxID=2830665 RepID=A0A9X1LLQ1_9MICO|nr:hypothetical protein [Microbacterium tenebrionis]MCC2027984.1 hypothetical protein [Microbacterium tenebrionis]
MNRRTRRRPLGTTLLLAGAVVLAVVGAPGTIAYLTDQATIPGATVSTGTAELTVSAVGAQAATVVYPGGPATRLHPTAAPTVTNTGMVPLAVTVTPSASGAAPTNFAGSVLVSVALQTSSSCAATPPAGTWSGTSGSVSGALVTLAPGQSRTLCAWQQLPTTAPNGSSAQTAAIALVLTGAQQ